MAVMIYALYTYHWRAASIRTGGRGPYDDRVGPVSTLLQIPPSLSSPDKTPQTILCAALLGRFYLPLLHCSIHPFLITVAIIVNFVLRFTDAD